MPSYTSGVAGQDIPSSVRSGAGCIRATRPIGRAIFGILLLSTVICLPVSGFGAESRTDKQAGRETTATGETAAELFAAIDQGTVEAKVIVRDQYHARVILRNKTDAPLTLKLPDAFAARPVLAQQNFPFPSGNQNQQQPQPQAVSGPFSSQSGNQGFNFGGNQGGQNQNFFGNNNVFNIAPESVRSISIKCFCVELGKPNPRSIHPYELVKFGEVGGDPKLAAVFDRYARGDLDREAVQAAVWHVVNEKSWDELGKLSRRIALNADAPIFSRQQLRLARDLVDYASREAAAHPDRYAVEAGAVALAVEPAPGVTETADSKAGKSVVDRPVPSSAEKYRTVRGIQARR
jgi:hypothetical protein